MASFAVSMSPALREFGPQNYTGHLDMRHTYFVTFATMMSAVGTFSVLGQSPFPPVRNQSIEYLCIGSTITLRNAFGSSQEAVVAWDKTHTLSATLLSGYDLLVRR